MECTCTNDTDRMILYKHQHAIIAFGVCIGCDLVVSDVVSGNGYVCDWMAGSVGLELDWIHLQVLILEVEG